MPANQDESIIEGKTGRLSAPAAEVTHIADSMDFRYPADRGEKGGERSQLQRRTSVLEDDVVSASPAGNTTREGQACRKPWQVAKKTLACLTPCPSPLGACL